jgi:hypothetical protein
MLDRPHQEVAHPGHCRPRQPIELIERDFALVTVAAHLTDEFPASSSTVPTCASWRLAFLPNLLP